MTIHTSVKSEGFEGILFPEITCVIARVPTYFISEGLSGKGKDKGPSGTSCWSYGGKDIPYAPYKTRTINVFKIHIGLFNRVFAFFHKIMERR